MTKLFTMEKYNSDNVRRKRKHKEKKKKRKKVIYTKPRYKDDLALPNIEYRDYKEN